MIQVCTSRYSKDCNLGRPEYNIRAKEIYQRQIGITNAYDEFPVLATFGLGKCVSLIGYDRPLEQGFLAHSDIDSASEFPEVLDGIMFEFFPNSIIEARIIGGETNQSELIIDIYKRAIESYKMNLIEEDTLGIDQNRHVCIDTRTGDTQFYNPNPETLDEFMRHLSKIKETPLIDFSQGIKVNTIVPEISYRPYYNMQIDSNLVHSSELE